MQEFAVCLSSCVHLQYSRSVSVHICKTFYSLAEKNIQNYKSSKTFWTCFVSSQRAFLYRANVSREGAVSGELHVTSSFSALTSSVEFKKHASLCVTGCLPELRYYAISYVRRGVLKIERNIGASYGEQYTGEISFDEIGDFMTDVYALRYISKNSLVDRKDVVRVLKALSNLLRNCKEYEINEVFLSTVRLKKVKDSDYYILVEY